jgi:5-methylcytosine-specific restriction enzyme B
MTNRNDIETKQPSWFVGACYSGTDDQLPRFLSEGIWENGYDDKLLDVVRSMRPGDNIAIKSSYTRKRALPFDNRGHSVSVLALKAVGTITENLNDGKRVRVAWKKPEPPREWYFYTNRGTVWRVLPGEWMADGLIAFAFENQPQDIDRFRNQPFWRERFGSATTGETRFEWAEFYEQIATNLLSYRHNREALLQGLKEIAGRVDNLDHLSEDQFSDGSKGFLRDICPFTVMGLFNRGLKDSNRIAIAEEMRKFLDVDVRVPQVFDGIPVLNPQKSWFFGFEKDRPTDQIDALWAVFDAAIKLADTDDDATRDDFATSFDGASGRFGVAWNLTFGLYWTRPWAFASLDRNSRVYVSKKLGLAIGLHGPKRRCNATDYLELMHVLESRFKESSYPVHSYPELSLEAWKYQDPTDGDVTPSTESSINESTLAGGEDDVARDGMVKPAPLVPYAIADILQEGCFLVAVEIDRLLERIRTKKNLILQGPPGTGKTWLAKRLAFALMGQRDESKIRRVQFHPNLSYEDFVRGWRPTGEGKLSLKDGVFMDVIKAASRSPDSKFVLIIEEINRGNPAQIFGEMLTLLEDSKRTPNEALELCYPDADGLFRPIHIPENVYLIGTMNVADRSLALVDMALRRRFAFVNLEPKLGAVWRSWVVHACALDPALVGTIEQKLGELNMKISSDERLGKQFCIGHSYVTPAKPLESGQTRAWFRQVVETEIGPLLEEYWFDVPAEADAARDRLLESW